VGWLKIVKTALDLSKTPTFSVPSPWCIPTGNGSANGDNGSAVFSMVVIVKNHQTLNFFLAKVLTNINSCCIFAM
jgi:hypothetical protein